MANSLTDEILSPQRYLFEILKFMRGSSGATQTVTITTLSANGTVAAGATSVEFHPSSDFAGTIAGVSYPGSAWQVVGPFTAMPGKLLGSIAVTRSAGSVNVIRVA